MRDSRGKRVGRCKEWVKVVGDSQVDARVLAMRHKDKGHIPPERHATKPERVLAYRSGFTAVHDLQLFGILESSVVLSECCQCNLLQSWSALL